MYVLIIEDDERVASLIQTVLEEASCRCVVACNTREADLALSTWPIEAMTVDLGLPGTAAVPWLEEIAEALPELAAKTVVVTGRVPDTKEQARIERCGAVLLLKPFALNELRELVGTWIGGEDEPETEPEPETRAPDRTADRPRSGPNRKKRKKPITTDDD